MLEALERQSNTSFEVLLLDNASSDGSADRAEAFLKEANRSALILRSDTNIGFAAGNNRLADRAQSDWIALLNPDAYPRENWIHTLAAAMSRYPETVCFGSRQISARDPNVADGAGDVFHILGFTYRGGYGWNVSDLPNEDRYCLSACGAAMLVKRSVFQEMGGFDERFFCYGEDIDLGLRLLARGYETIQLQDALVDHEGSAVTGRKSVFSVYHGQRNRVWGAAKSFPKWAFWLYAPIHLGCSLAQLLASAGHRKPYLHGLIDGWRHAPIIWKEAGIDERMSWSNLRTSAEWSIPALMNRRPRGRPVPVGRAKTYSHDHRAGERKSDEDRPR